MNSGRCNISLRRVPGDAFILFSNHSSLFAFRQHGFGREATQAVAGRYAALRARLPAPVNDMRVTGDTLKKTSDYSLAVDNFCPRQGPLALTTLVD